LSIKVKALSYKEIFEFCDKDSWPYNKVRRSFDTARRKAGPSDVKFQTLRKTFISWMAQRGHHPEVARRLAGGHGGDIYRPSLAKEQLREAGGGYASVQGEQEEVDQGRRKARVEEK